MPSWAATELALASLGDSRRTARLIALVTACAVHPTASIPLACGDWASTKAAYRFFATDALAPAAILAPHHHATVARIGAHPAPFVLALQDTTPLDFTAHPRTRGLGPLAPPTHHGLLVHSTLAVTPDGLPLGLLGQQRWTRDPDAVGQAATRRQRATADKESQRWLRAQAETLAVLPADVRVLTVADREADIFDLFAAPRRAGADLLIRATHDRRLVGETGRLWETIGAAPVLGTHVVAVGRGVERLPRKATLTLRVAAGTLAPPHNHRGRAQCVPQAVTVVLAEEETPPPATPAICWLLVTTRAVTHAEEAVDCVRWYALRWLIERYHYALKQGCQIEQVQLETAARLERAVATDSIVAWRLLWLTYLARVEPTGPCTQVLRTAEWQALWCATHHTPTPPETPPPLGEAVRWIARLGGFLGRRGDGEPGLKTIWRGLRRLEDLTAMWTLLHAPLVGKA